MATPQVMRSFKENGTNAAGREHRPAGLDCGFVTTEQTCDDVSCRALILPDWQGAHTAYAHRMARLFGSALKAETLIFNPYKAGTHPSAYPLEGEALVQQVISRGLSLRDWLVNALEDERLVVPWHHRDLPLILVGFCLGGTLAFEAARADANVSMSISIHGTPAIPGARVARAPQRVPMHLILGGDDKLVPEAMVDQFLQEMNQGRRDWNLYYLGNEGHSFTKEEVGFAGPLSSYSRPALEWTIELVKLVVKCDQKRRPEIYGDQT